jgi:hypothetical protein
LPVHSFHSLLADLATLTRNQIAAGVTDTYEITAYARPTPIRHKAFDPGLCRGRLVWGYLLSSTIIVANSCFFASALCADALVSQPD